MLYALDMINAQMDFLRGYKLASFLKKILINPRVEAAIVKPNPESRI